MNNQVFGGYDCIFASRFRDLLEKRKTTQSAIAAELGITRQSVSDYINGNTIPTADKLKKIADFFNIPTAYLLGETNAETKDEDVQFICDYTGLNSTSIAKLRYIQDEIKKAHRPYDEELLSVLDSLFSSSVIEECLEIIWNYRKELEKQTASLGIGFWKTVWLYLVAGGFVSDDKIPVYAFGEFMYEAYRRKDAEVKYWFYEGMERFQKLIEHYVETDLQRYKKAMDDFKSKMKEVYNRAVNVANGDEHKEFSFDEWREMVNGNDTGT